MIENDFHSSMITILGAGLSGVSCSFHLGHENCVVYEKEDYVGGHIYSHHSGGFTWDEGPHVSFTKHDYVRKLFEQSLQGEFHEYPVDVSNYYQGAWIPHPAQSNLNEVPEPERTKAFNGFMSSRNIYTSPPQDYQEWLEQAFGEAFAQTFPGVYTKKYWTVEPSKLSTDWVGGRVFRPDVETVLKGYEGNQDKKTHYIQSVRYPKRGGYIRFADKLANGANVKQGHAVSRIDLETRTVWFENGKHVQFQRLINTLPLPVFTQLANPPQHVRAAAGQLICSSLLLVNITAAHKTKRPHHWIYVYDEDKYSTRINCTELLSKHNAPAGKTGIQVEVYESAYRPFTESHQQIANKVVQEVKEMGLIESPETVHTRYVRFANVIFDHKRRENQEIVLNWLAEFGLVREPDDLEPMTDWGACSELRPGEIVLAGRFGQWKYFWTDDCVLRAKFIAKGVA